MNPDVNISTGWFYKDNHECLKHTKKPGFKISSQPQSSTFRDFQNSTKVYSEIYPFSDQ
jgi:hypothetical protein